MVRNYAIDKFGGLEMDFLQDKHAKLLVMSQTMKGESCCNTGDFFTILLNIFCAMDKFR